MTAKVYGLQGLDRRLRAIQSKAGDRAMLGGLAGRIVDEAKERVPRKTGHLGRTISFKGLTPRSVKVVAGADYAAAVEFGSGLWGPKRKRYTIKPKRTKALAFAASAAGARLTGSPRRGAGVVFARSVSHPGSPAQPFMVPAAKDVIKHGGDVTKHIIIRWNRAD